MKQQACWKYIVWSLEFLEDGVQLWGCMCFYSDMLINIVRGRCGGGCEVWVFCEAVGSENWGMQLSSCLHELHVMTLVANSLSALVSPCICFHMPDA